MTQSTHGIADVRRAVQDLRIAMEIVTERVAKLASLNPRDLGVLDVLHAEGPATPKAIAVRTGIVPTTLTAILSRLERDGRVRRHRNPDDGRSSTVGITDATVHELVRLYGDVNDELTRLVAAMPASHRAIVVEFVRNLTTTIHSAPR